MSKTIPLFFLLTTLCIFIYSFGFLDFNLTLSSNPLFLRFVAPIQHLVYFDRQVSAWIYGVLFALLMGSYLGLLTSWPKVIRQFPWRFFAGIMVIFSFSYPMLSYDLFNYMFHGKILLHYQMNPHIHAPLSFEGDLWLRFMRWVHTPSAYGPVFTLIELPAYALGLGKFVPVLLLMKATMSAFFVYCIYLVGKIGTALKMDKKRVILSQLLLAFNPFLFFELVINGHNDAVMIALLLLAILLMLQNKVKLSPLALAASIGVKFVTALALPIYLVRNSKYLMPVTTALLLIPVLLSPGRFQPWYLTWSLIPAVLIDRPWARLWIILTSISGIIFYVPYVRTGFWDNSLPFVAAILYLPILITLGYYIFSRKGLRL